MHKKLIILMTCLFLALFGKNFKKDFDEILSKDFNQNTPSISVAVISNGKIIYKNAFGMASLELDVPATTQSVYRIGSLSKQITAACIAMLIQDGELMPKDLLIDYFPELPADVYGKITMEQMVFHTSGIRDSENMYSLMGMAFSQWYTHEMLLKMLKRQKGLCFEPGSRYEYSNSAYTLLALIIEKVSGLPFQDYVRDKIFTPLGIKNSKIHITDKTFKKNTTAGYKLADSEYINWMTNNQLLGHDAVYSSVEDLFLWQQALERGKIGKYDLDMMKIPGSFNDGTLGNYGYGLVMGKYRGLDTYCHDGWYVGYKAFIITFPEQDFAVIALSNLGNKSVRPYAFEIIDLYLEDQLDKTTLPPITESKEFAKISGHEKFVRSELGGFKTLKSIKTGYFISPDDENEFCTADHTNRLKIYDDYFIRITSYGSRHQYVPFEEIQLSAAEKQAMAGEFFSHELGNTARIYLKNEKLHLKIGLEDVEIFQFAKDEFASSSSKLKLVRDVNDAISGLIYSTYSVRGIEFEKKK